jgi:hypothetical protein
MYRSLTALAILVSAPLAIGQFPRTRAVPSRPVAPRSAPASKATNPALEQARRRAQQVVQRGRRSQPSSMPSCAPNRVPTRPLTPEEQEAQRFFDLRLGPKETKAAISKINKKLRWHTRVSRAAKAAKLQDKPILWIQMLGKLGSYT